MSFAGFCGFARVREAKLGLLCRDRRSCATTEIIVAWSFPDGARAEFVERIWQCALINNAAPLRFDYAILIGSLPRNCSDCTVRAFVNAVAIALASLCRQRLRILIPLEPIRKLLESDESDVIPYQALDSVGERSMWKPEHRRGADRSGLRYPSDLSDAEWLIVEPMIPPAKRGGRQPIPRYPAARITSSAISENELLEDYYDNLHAAYNCMREAFQMRASLGLTQDNLAESLSVDKSLISRRLNGSENLTLKTFSFMGSAMKCRVIIQYIPYEHDSLYDHIQQGRGPLNIDAAKGPLGERSPKQATRA
jgi:hypothetical protein